MVVSRSGRIAAAVGVALLASTLQLSPARAVDSPIDQSGHYQVTPPGADARQSVLATTPTGLVEAYLQGTDLFVRRHTDETGWGPSTYVASDQRSDGGAVQAVAGTATRSFVVSVFLENGVERFRIRTYADDGSFIAEAGPGTGVAPKITAFADGSAVLTVLNEDGTEVHAWNVTADGLVLNDTVVASDVNGVDDPNVVADKDGLPLVLWEQCADAVCSTTDIRSATRTDAVTWSEPTTVLAGTQAVGLAAGSGAGKVLLNWLDEDWATGEIVSLALEQRSGVWGSPMEVGTFGYPMISPWGREVIADSDGYRSVRQDRDTTWTDGRIGLGRDHYCDAGGVPALEAHGYFLHEAIEDPAAPGTCRIIETREFHSNGDFYPPEVRITSYPSNRSGPSKQTVTFSSDSAVATLCQLDARPFTPCTSPLSYTGLQTGLHSFRVAGVDTAGNWSEYLAQSWSVDATAPTVAVSAPSAPLSLTNIAAAWRGSDVGMSGLASYDVRINKAPAGAGFSPWSTIFTKTLGTRTTLPGYPGYTVCIQVRGNDHAGNVGAWSTQRCAALPVDDRSLSASAGWSRVSGSPYFAKTITSTTKLGATLVSPTLQTTRLGLVATKCPSCGTVGVYVGSTLLAKVNLAAPGTSYANIISLPRISLRTTKVTVKVLTSGKPVQIDGLHSSRV